LLPRFAEVLRSAPVHRPTNGVAPEHDVRAPKNRFGAMRARWHRPL